MQLIKDATKEKLRGGFYTPDSIAKFILKWGMNGNSKFDILEPSCGDGVFLEQIKEGNYSYNSITAIEIDEIEVKKTEEIAPLKTKIINNDFHAYCNNTPQKFDLIIGNPPYIRYQYFDRNQQLEAERIFKRANLSYSKLTNAWVSFIVGSSLLLKEQGKIGFVLPAELLQVSYAKQLREFISRYYNKINIVSFRKLVFPDIQQEVVLLLCEKNLSNTHLIEHIEVENTTDLLNLDVSVLKCPQKRIDFKSNKWTFYFLEQKEIDFLESVTQKFSISKIGDFAKIEVGTTTGSNEFFSVPLSVVEAFNLKAYAKPLVGRSVQVVSPRFTYQDWINNRNGKTRSHFLIFPSIKEMQDNTEALKYLVSGENRGINKGYKCGIRDEWQIVPSAWISDALFIRRNNLYPKLIINEAKAYTTDTMHRVTIKKNTNPYAFCASFYNSLSLAFSEICGRSYGGGVLELMPSEAEEIILPYNETNERLLPKIDKMMRDNTPIEKILKYTDVTILKNNFRFSDSEIRLANNIWKKLSNRRINRSKV